MQVWVLDALPGEVRTGGEETQDHPRALIAHLRQISLPLPNRTALQNNLLDAGFSLTVARWASTNLQPLDGDHRSVSLGVARMLLHNSTPCLSPKFAMIKTECKAQHAQTLLKLTLACVNFCSYVLQ